MFNLAAVAAGAENDDSGPNNHFKPRQPAANEEPLANYKGIYYNNQNTKYFDPFTGAHFEFSDMCKRLELLLAKRLAEVPPVNSIELSNTLPLNNQLSGAMDQPLKATMPLREFPKECSAAVTAGPLKKAPPKIRIVAARLPSQSPTAARGAVKYFKQLKRATTKDVKTGTVKILAKSGLKAKKVYTRAETHQEVSEDVICPPLDASAVDAAPGHYSFQNPPYVSFRVRDSKTENLRAPHKRCKSECVGYIPPIPNESLPVAGVADHKKSRNQAKIRGEFVLPDPRKATMIMKSRAPV